MDRVFKFTALTPVDEVKAWLEAYGHRALFGQPGHPENPGGVMFDHGPGTRVQMALPGDTLTVRDNGTIVVD